MLKPVIRIFHSSFLQACDSIFALPCCCCPTNWLAHITAVISKVLYFLIKQENSSGFDNSFLVACHFIALLPFEAVRIPEKRRRGGRSIDSTFYAFVCLYRLYDCLCVDHIRFQPPTICCEWKMTF